MVCVASVPTGLLKANDKQRHDAVYQLIVGQFKAKATSKNNDKDVACMEHQQS